MSLRIRKKTSRTKQFAPLLVGVILLLLAGFLAMIYAGKMDNLWPATYNQPVNSLKDSTLYTAPNSPAAHQAEIWRTTQPDKAKLMDRLAALPIAHWLADNQSVEALAAHVKAATVAGKTPVLVSYFFPKRDCGRYSAGGARSGDEYKKFINKFADSIGNARAIVILEPDSISNIKAANEQGQPCLSDKDQHAHYSLMEYAVATLKAKPGVSLYIDAGNSQWVTNTTEVADRLKRAAITKADGFSLNVANFQTTPDTIAYGEAISRQLGGAHFVIDTSRNGNGPYANPRQPAIGWCNPPDRALGHYPTFNTGHSLVDAFLFIKRPGESDGADPDPHKCFGGPKAGEWWADYAVGLVERWPKELQPNK